MLEKIVTGAAGAVVAVLIISALTKFTDWISFFFEPTIPDGAVVAFLHPCEKFDGWKHYEDGAGKFLLGVGKGVLRPRGPHKPPGDPTKVLLSEIHFGDQGGQEMHKLMIEEMPEHNHDDKKSRKYLVQITGRDTAHEVDHGPNEINIIHGVEIPTAGKGQPHHNMPPYIALHFCHKTR